MGYTFVNKIRSSRIRHTRLTVMTLTVLFLTRAPAAVMSDPFTLTAARVLQCVCHCTDVPAEPFLMLYLFACVALLFVLLPLRKSPFSFPFFSLFFSCRALAVPFA